MDIKQLREAFEQRMITKVKLGGFDVDGVLRGKYVSLEKFWSALEDDLGFCDVIFGWDIGDALYDNAKVTGWHTGYPDTRARIDTTTFRVLPWEPNTAAFLMDFVREDESYHPACPRSLLKKVIARSQNAGLRPVFAAEYEFFFFKETPESLHQKGFRDLTPLSPGMFGYSWLREGQNSYLCHSIMDDMARFDIALEALHTETGPGVYEAAIRYDDALQAADKAALFKTALKQLAQRHGLQVTFMAKWNADLPGSSGHLHQSLWEGPPKKNAFFEATGPHRLSARARQYVAGQLALLPELAALYAPTVNSYKRFVPGVWAPLNATWGIENRTTALRAIPAGPMATRIETRVTAADINPYIAMAAALASGLWGIETEREAPPPVEGDASQGARTAAPLPRCLKDATQALARSEPARQLLGEEFVDHYVRTRDWEVRQYERAVTEWELRRYFEGV